uniref:DIRP domain-containing protein n=1 Tax=Steinernema glaseri TaxID=37863 RepID=A0A1I7XVG4_9BILA
MSRATGSAPVKSSNLKAAADSERDSPSGSDTKNGRTAPNDSPYRLRGNSKVPSRYRDYLSSEDIGSRNRVEADADEESDTSARSRRGKSRNTPAKRVSATGRYSSERSASETFFEDEDDEAKKKTATKKGNSDSQPIVLGEETGDGSVTSGFAGVERYNQPIRNLTNAELAQGTHLPPRRIARTTARTTTTGNHAELTDSLKNNLRRLKNVLKLPKARRWVYCEYFYSGVDQQIFLGDNEFCQLLRESFPNLRCRTMNRQEWRTIRRLIGKPRRCSQAFLNEERQVLEAKREKIRQIYDGTCYQIADYNDLPQRLPRPLAVGMKVYARVRHPKDGIYAGTIDAVLPDSYRIVFEKEEMIPPMNIRDSEVMAEQRLELVSMTYFLEMNRASMPHSAKQQLALNSTYVGHSRSIDGRNLPSSSQYSASSAYPSPTKRYNSSRDEKVGNFPVRMLVILVKLAKLIETKRQYLQQITSMNDEAQRMNLVTTSYPEPFKEKYARLVVDIELLNKMLKSYLSGINEYNAALLPHLSENSATTRPEALRKLCNTHATQIVKHCNNGLNVQDRHCLQLITSLTALLLQVRSLGQQKCTPYDLNSLSESINDIRAQIYPKNAGPFQDTVEIHMKQIYSMMLSSSAR